MSKKSILLLFILLLSISTAMALDIKQVSTPVQLKDKEIHDYSANARLATDEYCTVMHVGDPWWLIPDWLSGQELYKSYQDPALTCDKPYPFSVEEVYMLFYVTRETIIYASVDVETADMTDPLCPQPGNLVSVSSEYGFQLYLVNDSPTLWRVVIPLDSAAVMDAPYFCGFYLSTPLVSDPASTQDSVWLVTDDYPAICTDYNLWDDAIGFIDLGDEGNGYGTFPGRINLYSAGTTGGTGGYEEPLADLQFVTPQDAQIVSAPLNIWVADIASSPVVDSVKFEYRSSTEYWTRFDVNDGSNRAIRNGVDPSGTGQGFLVEFPSSGKQEDVFTIRATAFDSYNRAKSAQIDVNLDPTPPRMDIVSPVDMETICLPYTLTADTDDDDLTTVTFYSKPLKTDYGVTVVALNQSDYGDVNGYPDDGNTAANGEFGEYYCGPVAGAIALKYWNDHGHTEIMTELLRPISVDTVVERLAAVMQTRDNNGTYDDFMVYGLNSYISSHGNNLYIDNYLAPDYMTLRKILEEKEQIPILGLSGTPGLYIVLSGFSGLDNGAGVYAITVSDPLTGMLISTNMRESVSGPQVLYGGIWLDLEIAFAVGAKNYTNARDMIGTAVYDGSHWTYNWQSASWLSDDSLYYFTAIGIDSDTRKLVTSRVFQYNCNLNRVAGDYNGDDLANATDVLVLINFIYNGGDAPVGGAHRADANCDLKIDIGDILYLVKYLYEGGEIPCH